MANIIAQYINGNYMVTLYDNGKKKRKTVDKYFNAFFPESIDCKITNCCPIGCPMCHEQSTPQGKHGRIMELDFINSLHPGTEVAIGGGAVTSHPKLIEFLNKLKEQKLIANITVNQLEFKKNKDLINYLVQNKLIYGLGVSFYDFDDAFWDNLIKSNDNVVVHLIAGIHGQDVFDYLASKNAKILILGYKNWGRGALLLQTKEREVINKKIEWLKDNLKNYIKKFQVVSFDNLAITQLHVRDILPSKVWQEFYQGDDGTHTMYVDCVKEEFAQTSTSVDRFPLLDNIDDMFHIVKEKKL